LLGRLVIARDGLELQGWIVLERNSMPPVRDWAPHKERVWDVD